MKGLNRTLTICLSLLAACSSISDVTPEETFVKYYGDDAFYEVKDLIKITESNGAEGFVILSSRLGEVDVEIDDGSGGTTTITFPETQDFYITHFRGDGSLVQQKRIPFIVDDGAGGTKEDFGGSLGVKTPSRINQTNDGFLLVGSRNYPSLTAPGESPSLIVWAELDTNFELIDQGSGPVWNALGDTVSNFYGVDIAEMADGGLLVAGYTDQNGSNDYFYKKIGGTEDEWERTQTRANSDDQLVRLIENLNGNFTIIGRTDALSDDGEGGANVERTIIDPQGVIQNSAVYGITSFGGQTNLWDIPQDVIERPGGFTIVGTSFLSSDLSDGAPFFMNVDLVGAAGTEVSYLTDFNPGYQNGPPQFAASAFGVTRMLNNDLMIVGQTEGFVDASDERLASENGQELMFFTTDQEGERISAIRQQGLVNGDDAGVRALSTNDGGVLIAANYDFGGGLQQIAVLKVNLSGELKQ